MKKKGTTDAKKAAAKSRQADADRATFVASTFTVGLSALERQSE
jgi:hypothetical protein